MPNDNVVPITPPRRPASTSDQPADPADLAELIAAELAHLRAAGRRLRDIANGRDVVRSVVELDALGTNIEGLTERIYHRIYREAMPELDDPRRPR